MDSNAVPFANAPRSSFCSLARNGKKGGAERTKKKTRTETGGGMRNDDLFYANSIQWYSTKQHDRAQPSVSPFWPEFTEHFLCTDFCHLFFALSLPLPPSNGFLWVFNFLLLLSCRADCRKWPWGEMVNEELDASAQRHLRYVTS